MTKIEFIAAMAEKYVFTKKGASAVYDAVFETIENALLDGIDVRTPIGTFKVKEVPDREFTVRMGVNKGEKSISPAHKVVRFKPSAGLKETIK